MASKLRAHVRSNLVAYLALGIALAATASVAYSAIPDANSVIHGCYAGPRGALRVIDTEAGGTCDPGETALDWNQKGQPGAPGPAGPPGATSAYGRSKAGPIALPKAGQNQDGQQKTVATLTVPSGSYAIFVKAIGVATTPTFVSTGFGCIVKAGASSDLGAARLASVPPKPNAYQTVSANLLHTFTASSNTISLKCLQFAGSSLVGASIQNARLIAMRVDQINPSNAFRASPLKIKPKRRATPPAR